MKRRIGVSVAAALLISWCSLASAETAADWDWYFAPYLWGPSVSLDVTVDNDPVVGADASFEDLLDKTDIAGMFHFEGQCEHAGFLVDALFLDLGSNQTTTARPPLPSGTQTTLGVTIGIYEAAGFYRPGGKAHGLDLIFGARMYDYRSRLEATFPAPINAKTSRGTDKNLIDAFGGVRYLVPIGKRWDFVARGDVGTGGSDLSWNAHASFGVRLGKTDLFNLRFGWRYMELDVTKDAQPLSIDMESDLTLNGPIIGFAMKF
jgi:hypothetical protein